MRIFLPFVILLALLMASLAMQPDYPKSDLVVSYTSIETLDVHKVHFTEDIRISYALFEGLYSYEATTFKIIPGVALRHDLSPDGKTYTFHLRKDAYWSDGTLVTSRDFKMTWMLGMMPDFASHYVDFFRYIKNSGDNAFYKYAQERTAAAAKEAQALPPDLTEARRYAEIYRITQARLADTEKWFDQNVGVRTPDDFTLVVELENPTPFYLDIVSFPTLFPIHPQVHLIEPPQNVEPTGKRPARYSTRVDPGTMLLQRDPQWTKSDRLICNGPYRLDEWQFKRWIRLSENPHYWNRANTSVKTVLVHCLDTMNTAFRVYETGGLDLLIEATSLSYMPELLATKRKGLRDDVHENFNFGTYYYNLNCRERLPDGSPNPFHDPRVRKAFAMSVDKNIVVEKGTRLFQPVSNVFVPRDVIPGYKSPDGLGYDPELARKLLAEAGYPDGRGFPACRLILNTGLGHEPPAQVVLKMWEKNLGVKISIDGNETQVFAQKRSKGDFHVSRNGWWGDYTDPTTFLDLLQSGNGQNESRYNDPHYDDLLAKAAKTLEPGERFKILSEAETYMLQEGAPIMPLYFYKVVNLFKPGRVKNVSAHPRGLHMFHQLEVIGR